MLKSMFINYSTPHQPHDMRSGLNTKLKLIKNYHFVVIVFVHSLEFCHNNFFFFFFMFIYLFNLQNEIERKKSYMQEKIDPKTVVKTSFNV